MRTLIVYSSQTGNTRKLAEAVGDCWPGETEMVSVDAAPEPKGYDCVAVGFWLQAGKPDLKAAEYLQKIDRMPLFLFATHGAAADSAHVRKAMASALALAPEAEILGTFNCPGEVAPKVLEKIRSKTPSPPWLQDAPSAVGHPNAQDLENLRKVINGLAEP